MHRLSENIAKFPKAAKQVANSYDNVFIHLAIHYL